MKNGIKFDYDLDANKEIKKDNICIICNNELSCRWADYSGEGVCLTCGTPYQLKWGSEEQRKEAKYPYCNLNKKYINIIREYWNDKKTFVFLGRSFNEHTGIKELNEWLEINHPELIEKNKNG